jgi:hypothetical protein
LIVVFVANSIISTINTMTTREQLQTAVILCNSQEEQVEILQLCLSGYPEDWQPRATLWCQQAIQQIQQNAVVLDALLEQVDEGKTVEPNQIPPTPPIFTRLLTLEKHKEKLGDLNNLFEEAVGLNNVELLELLLQDVRADPSVKNNYAIRLASCKGHLTVVDRLLQDPRVDPSANNNEAIRRASENGHLAVVNRLLQDSRVDPSVDDNYAICFSSEKGHLDVVDRLLQDERVDPSANDSISIYMASVDGYLAVVDRLLQYGRVDPSAWSNSAIRAASCNGHLAVVDRLLQDPRVNPSADNNNAIRVASKNGYLAVVDRLLQDPVLTLLQRVITLSDGHPKMVILL